MGKKAVQWRARTGIVEVGSDSEYEYITVRTKKAKKLESSAEDEPEMTRLHIFNKADRIWHARFRGKDLDFKAVNVDAEKTIAELMEKITAKARNIDLDKYVITEVFELGNGVWRKGTTIAYDSDKSAEPLDSFGWDASRGKTKPPVWLCVHRKH